MLVGTYKVDISLQGFRSATFTKVSIAVGQEYALTARLELGNVSENVTVEAGTSLVPTTSPEVTTTVEQQQIVSLPLNGRNPISLVQLQAGVASLGRTNTAINGGRPTWTQVTQDGINIQDNFIRTNSVDFVPNRPTADNVGEFSIVTTAQGVDNAGGASQVRMITPSGTNAFKGNAYEYNRNSRFAENTFFNKQIEPARQLPQSQSVRGSVGGPVIRDKLFFYANYEAFRQKQQVAQNYTIPVRNDLLTGNFRYFVAADGSVRTGERAAAVGADDRSRCSEPRSSRSIPSPDNVNSYDSGDSRADRILNTGRYRFLQDDFNDRNQWVTRADYALNSNHRFEFIYSYICEDRRSHRPRHGHAADAARVHRSARAPVRRLLALDGFVAAPERASHRRQPRARGLQERRRLQQRRSAERAGNRVAELAARDFPAAGAQHAHLPVQRHREPDGGQPRAAVRREHASRSASTRTTSRRGSRP